MSVMIILLSASLLVGLIFLGAFLWSVRNGQFDDHFSPAHKILFENKTQQHQEYELNNQEDKKNNRINK